MSYLAIDSKRQKTVEGGSSADLTALESDVTNLQSQINALNPANIQALETTVAGHSTSIQSINTNLGPSGTTGLAITSIQNDLNPEITTSTAYKANEITAVQTSLIYTNTDTQSPGFKINALGNLTDTHTGLLYTQSGKITDLEDDSNALKKGFAADAAAITVLEQSDSSLRQIDIIYVLGVVQVQEMQQWHV